MHKLLLVSILLAALLCVAVAAVTPWFEVPFAADRPSGAESQITTESSHWIVVFQWFTVAATLVSIGFWMWLPTRRYIATAVAAFGLVFLLLFPHCQMAWQPALTAHASWLQIQHENLTWFGGDIYCGQELEATPAQMRMYLSDSPRHVAVMKLPTWRLDAVGLNQLPHLLDWLGYTNTFCQFVALGWPLAVCGLSLVFMLTIFKDHKICVARLRTGILTLLVCGLAGVAIAGNAPFRASLMLQKAAAATHRGNHRAAFQQLVAAARTWPPLREDTWFVAQMGLTQNLIGISSSHADLHKALALESAHQFDRAADVFRRLASAEDPDSPIRREASRGILRYAIRALNSGETAKSARGFRFVLDVEPCNIKALYALQVAYGQQGQSSGVQAAHRQLADVYAHLNFPNKRIVLGKSLSMADRPLLIHRDSRSPTITTASTNPNIARATD